MRVSIVSILVAMGALAAAEAEASVALSLKATPSFRSESECIEKLTALKAVPADLKASEGGGLVAIDNVETYCRKLFPVVATSSSTSTGTGTSVSTDTATDTNTTCAYSELVCKLYAAIGRHPDKIDPAGAAYWQSEFDRGYTYEEALRDAQITVQRADEVAAELGLPDSTTLLNGNAEQQKIYWEKVDPELRRRYP